MNDSQVRENLMLSVEGVSVTYGSGPSSVRALSDVSISFEPGKLTLIMGPSGSGKTTLLSVLGCLLAPESGQVRVMGRLATGLSEDEAGELRRRYIGYVFQAFRLFHSLSALENMLIALEINRCRGSRARRAAHRALEEVGLGDKWRLKPAELSAGEKQRVAVARALLKDPPIILADEPTSSLDSVAGEQIAEMLRSLATKQGRLVVVVTHDPRWLNRADRIVTMSDGKLISDTLKDTILSGL